MTKTRTVILFLQQVIKTFYDPAVSSMSDSPVFCAYKLNLNNSVGCKSLIYLDDRLQNASRPFW